MPSKVEIGKSIGSKDTINLLHTNPCDSRCEYKNNPQEYDCIRHNGNATIVFPHGITRMTIKEVKDTAICLIKD